MNPVPGSYGNITTFGASSSRIVPISSIYNGGYQAGQGFPAEHENYLMNSITNSLNIIAPDLQNIHTELINYITSAYGGQSINSGSVTQLQDAISHHINYQVTLSMINSLLQSATTTNIGIGMTPSYKLDVSGIVRASSFIGDVSGNISGNSGSSTYSSNSTITDSPSAGVVYLTFVTANTGNMPLKTNSGQLRFNTSSGTLTVPYFSGNGASLTSINASNITSGTIANARLPSDISVTSLTGTHYGNGASLTSINASNITSGTIANARLPSDISVTSLTGTHYGNGANLTSLTGANVTGTVPLANNSNNLGGMSSSTYYVGYNMRATITSAFNLPDPGFIGRAVFGFINVNSFFGVDIKTPTATGGYCVIICVGDRPFVFFNKPQNTVLTSIGVYDSFWYQILRVE